MSLEKSLIIFGFWGVSEIGLTLFKRAPQASSIKDTNSFAQNIIIWPSVLSGIGIAVFCNAHGIHWMNFAGDRTIWQITGLILLVAGVLIRWSAIITLGKFFSANLTIQDDHKIIKMWFLSLCATPKLQRPSFIVYRIWMYNGQLDCIYSAIDHTIRDDSRQNTI